MRRVPAAVICAAALAAGCGGQGAPGTTPAGPVTTTSTGPTTTSTGSTTTSTGPTTTRVVPSTTTTSPAAMALLVEPSVFYTTAASVAVQGHATLPSHVTVGGLPAEAGRAEDGGTDFWAEVGVEPGIHLIAVTAIHRYSPARTTRVVTVIADPTLEERFAFLISVDFEGGTVTVDFAEILGGEEAEQAAEEDGAGPLGDPVYIRNPDPEGTVLPLAQDPVILLQASHAGFGPVQTTVGADAWAELTADPDAAFDLTGFWWYGGGQLPFWLTIDDGIVVQMAEQYLP